MGDLESIAFPYHHGCSTEHVRHHVHNLAKELYRQPGHPDTACTRLSDCSSHVRVPLGAVDVYNIYNQKMIDISIITSIVI